MTRYWDIAPFDSTLPEIWEQVWQFDLANSIISIGWRELGDLSGFTDSELKAALQRTYGNIRSFNMIWNFYHGIQADDIVIARRGRKRIAAVGTVLRPAYYNHALNIEAAGPDHAYPNHLDVHWYETPRDKEFDRIVFGMQPIYEISESQYRELVGKSVEGVDEVIEQGVENKTEFLLEG